MPSLNPFTRKKKNEGILAAALKKQEDDAAHSLWLLQQERERHQKELQFQEQLLRHQEEAREAERIEYGRRLAMEKAAHDRRQQAAADEAAARDAKLREEHAARVAHEKKKAALLQLANREREAAERQAADVKRAREEKHKQARRVTTPEAIQSLREMIRRKYELDMSIWADRKVRRPLRPEIEIKMEQADAAYMEILSVVRSWEEVGVGKGAWQKHEWELVMEVKARCEDDGDKRWWYGNPPWEEN
ncbi:hypothetical protein IQ07DRAFT_173635 [Pyrenochaeta sp. DS3sAY3a]|nr:hypothetical protein IQ07DRAFT_173635 [Pyrenochaeta sp. DS3sAY3a]